jgi:two-component system, NarL family, response regulator LiaR
VGHGSTLIRVIIADDHPLWRAALGDLLRRNADLAVVAEAADGSEAVEMCRHFKPDLLVIDLRMPRMDGLEATRAIKRELPRTVVLALTGYEDPILLAEALNAGASGYVLKGACPEEITDAVFRAVKGELAVNPGLAKELLLRLTAEIQNEGSLEELLRQRTTSQGQTEAPFTSLLSLRELEVLRLVARGYTNKAIARSLMVSVSTVKKYVHALISKLEVSDRTQAAIKALKLGLLADEEEKK